MAAILDAFYTALKAQSAPELAKCVTEDFVLEWQGTPAIPWAGTWRGVDGLLSFVRELNARVEICEAQSLHRLQDASVTLVVLRGHWRLVATNREIRATACNLFTFEGEKIRSYTVLNNSAAFAEGLAFDAGAASKAA